MHTYIHTYIHAYIHTYIHTYRPMPPVIPSRCFGSRHVNSFSGNSTANIAERRTRRSPAVTARPPTCRHTSAHSQHMLAYVCIIQRILRQHTSAYVSIRQHNTAYSPAVTVSPPVLWLCIRSLLAMY